MDPNSLMLWLHCNKCIRQVKDDPKLTMHFTNCGHFFCHYCVEKNTSPKCFVCGAAGVRAMILGPNVSPDILEMFQNTMKLPQKLHKAMEFQQGHIRQTLHLNRLKAEKMTKLARNLMEECKMYKNKTEQNDKECAEMQRRLNAIYEKRRQRAASNMHHQRHADQGLSLEHSNAHYTGRHSQMYQPPTSMHMRPETPSFQGMEVNAFDPKTPDAFKTGKLMLSDAVNLQAMQQEKSPGNHVRSPENHVRNLFSPKEQDLTQQEHRRLSGSGGDRQGTGLGFPQRHSPYNVGRNPITRSPNMVVNTGYQSLR